MLLINQDNLLPHSYLSSLCSTHKQCFEHICLVLVRWWSGNGLTSFRHLFYTKYTVCTSVRDCQFQVLRVCEAQYKRALDLEMITSTRFNLEFLSVFSKTLWKASFHFFSPKKLVWLFVLKEVKASLDSKMIKLLAFDNLFPPL